MQTGTVWINAFLESPLVASMLATRGPRRPRKERTSLAPSDPSEPSRATSLEFDAALLKERAALAKNRMKLEFGILSHRTPVRIEKAYLAAVVGPLVSTRISGRKAEAAGKEGQVYSRAVQGSGSTGLYAHQGNPSLRSAILRPANGLVSHHSGVAR